MELCAFKRNNFILNKLIPCLMIIMFAFMCLYGSSVYASSNSTISINNIGDITLPSWYNNYYWFISAGDGLVCIFISDSEFTVKNGPFGLDVVGTLNCWSISESGVQNSLNGYTNAINISEPTLSTISNPTLVGGRYANQEAFTNFDILDNNGNVVFQAPPQVQETQAIIVEQVGELEMNRTLSEILGILPIVIVVIVGLIAIRKGIIFLMARMKKA